MTTATWNSMRTQFTSGPGAQTIDNEASPFLPAPANVAAPHLPYHIQIDPTAGAGFYQPNRTVTFNFSTEAQLLTKVNLRLFLDRLLIAGDSGASVATATFAAYVDWIGLAHMAKATMRFGLETLQIVRPLEMLAKIESCYNDEMKNNLRRMLKGTLSFAERNDLRQNNRQHVMVPFLTLLGLHLGADPSQNFYVRGLGELIRFEIETEPAFHWLVGDGSVELGTALGTEVTATTALPTSGQMVQEGHLYCEYQFITEDEEATHQAVWSMARRYLFREAQYIFEHVVPAATPLNGLDYNDRGLRFDGINQPVRSIYVFLRWQNDLNRDFNGANGSRGRNLFNIGGWQNPGGVVANRSIVSSIALRIGNDTFALRPTAIETLDEYEHARKFLGTGSGGIIKWTYEHLPCDENSATGYLDFSQSERPQLVLTLRNLTGILTTVGDAKAADIGGSTSEDAGLVVSVYADTINKLALDRNTAKHTIN